MPRLECEKTAKVAIYPITRIGQPDAYDRALNVERFTALYRSFFGTALSGKQEPIKHAIRGQVDWIMLAVLSINPRGSSTQLPRVSPKRILFTCF